LPKLGGGKNRREEVDLAAEVCPNAYGNPPPTFGLLSGWETVTERGGPGGGWVN